MELWRKSRFLVLLFCVLDPADPRQQGGRDGE